MVFKKKCAFLGELQLNGGDFFDHYRPFYMEIHDLKVNDKNAWYMPIQQL